MNWQRVYDVAGCMGGYGGSKVKVYLDKNRLQVSSFKEYMSMYEGMEAPVIFESIGQRWEVGVAASPDCVFQQVSFVNAICTTKGGNHVNHVADQVINRLLPVLKRKNKAEVKGHFVKNHLCVYVNGLVENPAFNSQSKEYLTTKDSAFGSVPMLSETSLKAIEKSEIVERVLSWAKHKQNQQLNKKSGKKSSKLTGIVKLDDANDAGTSRSQDCTLILTEGDSAKTLAVSGLGVVGRDRYGVFPLKGKLLNVREATNQQVLKNEEIQNIVKILGLKFNHDYMDTKSLRYGHLMIMTDQDHDGSHIKGLLINLLHHYWPSLLKIDGFLEEFITPIVKVNKGQQEKSFYTLPEYEIWKETHNNGKGWNAKYYKGLGTSTAKEAKEYFASLDVHQLEFEWKDDHLDADLIDMAFSKKRVEDRKDWLRGFKAGTHADYNVQTVTYDSFVNQELILFSVEDNKRSIPSLVDGFKPSQRKVLFSCFKRNLKKEIKVVQLAGYVSEHSAYHHGEASLNSTIVGMAQNYVGSNNLGLLTPGGQFGTRLMGGKDSASPRYIFTCLEKAARVVFHPDDDPLLTYLDDDGLSIEPEFYVPVLPLILVNGCDGIGTGWSSQVPNYCPRDVIENLRRKIKGQPMVEMQPWYEGFVGEIEVKQGKKGSEGGYCSKGIIKRTGDDKVEILELPIRKWTQDYKQFLESLLPGAEEGKAKGGGKKTGGDKAKEKTSLPCKYIKDFKENHTDTSVHFTVTMSPADIDELEAEAGGGGLMKFFKLESSVTTSNMVLFDNSGLLVKYDSPQHIMESFYGLRMDFYDRRKRNLLAKMQREWSKLDNKVRFILAVVEERLIVSNRKKAELLLELQREGYDIFLPETARNGTNVAEREDGEHDSDEEDDSGSVGVNGLAKGYDYLLSMKIWSLTLERVKNLEEELVGKTEAMDKLKKTTPSELWLKDLDALSDVLDELAEINVKQLLEDEKQRRNASKRGGKGGRGRGRMDDDDSDFEDGPKKKKGTKSKGNALKGSLPPPSVRLDAPPLAVSSGGGKVSAAFALAEEMGKVVSILDSLSLENSPRVGSSESEGHGGAEVSPVVTMKAASSKDRMGMSLAERVRERFQASSASAGAGPVLGKATKATIKKTAVTRKPTARADSDLDSDLEDIKMEAPKVTAKVKVPAKSIKRAKAPLLSESDDDNSDVFDSGSEGEMDSMDLVKEVVPITRPSRRAATSKPVIVDSESEGGGYDEEGQEDGDVTEDSDGAFLLDDEEDDYKPTPAKPKAVASKAKTAGTSKAKASAASKPKVDTMKMKNVSADAMDIGELEDELLSKVAVVSKKNAAKSAINATKVAHAAEQDMKMEHSDDGELSDVCDEMVL
ncbi:unnamed protein product, partial [Choristocarpus tenellus]